MLTTAHTTKKRNKGLQIIDLQAFVSFPSYKIHHVPTLTNRQNQSYSQVRGEICFYDSLYP